MLTNPPTMTIPLQADEHGIIRVSGTRVTLDTVLARYSQGDTPEAIHEGFETLPVNDVYAVIAYYLAHREELDAYLKRRQDQGERLRQEIEDSYTPEQQERHDRLRKLAETKRHHERDG